MNIHVLLLIAYLVSETTGSSIHETNATITLTWNTSSNLNTMWKMPHAHVIQNAIDYMYFWEKLKTNEPHLNDITARGIILEINFQNSTSKQISFDIASKQPKSPSKPVIANVCINFEEKYVKYKTVQSNNLHTHQLQNISSDAKKHTILLQARSIYIDYITRIELKSPIDVKANVLKFDVNHNTFINKIWYTSSGKFSPESTLKNVDKLMIAKYAKVTKNFLAVTKPQTQTSIQTKQKTTTTTTPTPTQPPSLTPTKEPLASQAPTHFPTKLSTQVAVPATLINNTLQVARTQVNASITTLNGKNTTDTVSRSTTNSNTEDDSLYIVIAVSTSLIFVVCVISLVVMRFKSSQYAHEQTYHTSIGSNVVEMKPVLEASAQKKNIDSYQLSHKETTIGGENNQTVENENETQGFADIVGDAAFGESVLMDEIVGQMSRTKGSIV